MTRRTTLFATLLAAALLTPALAHPGHQTARDTAPNNSPPRMSGGMIPGNPNTRGNMHSGMSGMMGSCNGSMMPGNMMPGGMHSGMHSGMMGSMHGGTMGDMHAMMAQMHGTIAGQSQGMMYGTAIMPGLESLAGAEFEVAFMSMMIAHHQGAATMADWALERSDDADVLAAARAIKAAQEPEIEQMTTWLRDWYDADVDAAWSGMMHADMAGMMTAMDQGADPDTAFLTEMIRHHQGAIDMAQLALERAEHEELRALARDIILAQTEEVYQYQTWLDQAPQ